MVGRHWWVHVCSLKQPMKGQSLRFLCDYQGFMVILLQYLTFLFFLQVQQEYAQFQQMILSAPPPQLGPPGMPSIVGLPRKLYRLISQSFEDTCSCYKDIPNMVKTLWLFRLFTGATWFLRQCFYFELFQRLDWMTYYCWRKIAIPILIVKHKWCALL